MTRALPRIHFNSSRLVRVLADWSTADVAAPRESFAERLGQWVDVADAMTLFSALNVPNVLNGPPVSTPGAEFGTSPSRQAVLQDELVRVRTDLVNGIASDEGAPSGGARIKLPQPQAGSTAKGAADYSPYHRYYLAQQREMEARIGPLRATVRAVLSRHSSTLRQLALLDAALDRALGARERAVLATVPQLLEHRFVGLRMLHQRLRAESGAPEDGALSGGDGGWLAAFCSDMQRVLLAELDLRLQPVEGLIAAYGNEVMKQQ